MARKKVAKVLSYTAVFEPAEEGGYIVTVPALPGCVTQGETFEEASANIQEAAELYLEDLKDSEIPEEKKPIIVSPLQITL